MAVAYQVVEYRRWFVKQCKSREKSSSVSGLTTKRRGGGVRSGPIYGRTTKEKLLFLFFFCYK